ncbi:putative adenylyltransferase/sulfurtransferase MoeZ [mine drainage metagenome]|uniref:Putative adenylyltransferase/sulfurtransferase MoeZ n=1 Tax=mine drainage metagenome TaxID=410659 RepID=A0A1J5SM69_9ZZZZ
MDFSEDQMRRYARHIILPEIGGVGQARLLRSRVLVVGAGGLGSPLILYLAAAGVGTIGVVDDDRVDLTNLQRQILHRGEDIGQLKVDSAARQVAALNGDVRLVRHPERLTRHNAAALLAGYDVVADGSDSYATRLLVNDACRLAGKTLVSAAVLRFNGQLATFRPGGPCYRCLYPALPGANEAPSCAQAGILGAMAGVMGSLQAVEVCKELLELGDSLAGSLLVVDLLTTSFRKVRLPQDPHCPLCGSHPTLHDLSGHGEAETGCG